MRLRDLHSIGVIHQDIKPENILCNRSSPYDSNLEVYLIDFGLSSWYLDENKNHIE